MIIPSAVEAWMSRPLKNSRRAKDYTLDDLIRKVTALSPIPTFYTQPKIYQYATFLYTLAYPGALLFLDPGLGKTKITLDSLAYRKRIGSVKRTLVLVPCGSNVDEWVSEARKHRPDLSVVGLTGSRAEREHLLHSPSDVVVVTYAGFLSLTCSRPSVCQDEPEARRKGMTPDLAVLDWFAESFQALVYDESSYLGNQSTLIFRVLMKLAPKMVVRIALTGTPFGTTPHQLWPQFRLTDLGETLGSNMGLFRAAFFTAKKNFWGGYVYEFRKDRKPQLERMLAHRSIRYTDEELELPPLVGGITSKDGPVIREVVFTDELWAYYHRISDELRAAEGNPQLVENAFFRMRSITSGYLAATTEMGDRIEVTFKINPKLERLMELLQEFPADKKVVVFHVLRPTGKIISDALTKARIKHSRLYGGSNQGEKRAALRAFREGSDRVLVASEAAAYGLNLQVGKYLVVYESPVSPTIRVQVEKRLHRQGQTETVRIYDIVVRGSVDMKILEALKSRRNLFKELINGERRKRSRVIPPKRRRVRIIE